MPFSQLALQLGLALLIALASVIQLGLGIRQLRLGIGQLRFTFLDLLIGVIQLLLSFGTHLG
ncbi:hypothetical protein D3C77_612840 [compost metagenome]